MGGVLVQLLPTWGVFSRLGVIVVLFTSVPFLILCDGLQLTDTKFENITWFEASDQCLI